MPRPRKPASQPDKTSVHAEGRSVAVGGDVINSTIVIGDNVHIQSGRTPLGAELISKLTEQYKRAIEREWSILRVNEVEISLKDVYVMLQAVASLPPKELDKKAELAELPERMRHAGFEPKESNPVRVELSQALKEAQHLVLLGEPGGGKSTTLQFIGLCFVHEDWAEARLQLTEQKIPIKLDLRGYADILAEPGTAMEQALNRAVREFLRDLSEEDARELLHEWSDEGRLLVLLDGLDEVSDQHRRAVHDEIQKFASWMTDRKCRLVVTSRLAGYSAMGGNFKEFILKPFEHSEEAIPYLQSWLAVLRQDWKQEQAQTEAINLHDRMNAQPALRRILDNPLLLRISAQVYARDRQIATSRADLYQRHIEELWVRAVERGVDRNKKDDVWKAIEYFAWGLQTNNLPSISTEMEIILRENMGLVVRVGEKLAFSHTTLQEYFVAQRLGRAWQENQNGAWAFLRLRLHISTWREALLLLCGSLDPEKAGELVLDVISASGPFENRLYRDKLLGATLLGENRTIMPSIRKKVIYQLIRLLKYGNWEVCSAVIRVLGETKPPEAVPELIQIMKDKDKTVRETAIMALGEIKASEAIPALIQAFQDVEKDVRRSAVAALIEIKEPKAVPVLIQALQEKDKEVRKMAIEVLGGIQSANSLPYLIRALQDEDEGVRLTALAELEGMKAPEAFPGLIRELKDDEDWYSRRMLDEYLKEVRTPDVIPYMLPLLEDSDADIRGKALWAIRRMELTKCIEALPALIEALDDEEEFVCGKALQLVEEILDNPKAQEKARNTLPGLTRLLQSPDVYKRLIAVNVLARTRLLEAVPILIKAFTDNNQRVCDEAIYGFKLFNSREAVIQLQRSLHNENSDIRLNAVRALRETKTRDALLYIDQMLSDDDGRVRVKALRALCQIKLKEAVPELIHAIQDRDKEVRLEAVLLLGELQAQEAASDVMRLLSDSEMRGRALWALGEMRVKQSIPELIRALQDDDSRIQDIAVWAVGRIKAIEAVPHLLQILRDETG